MTDNTIIKSIEQNGGWCHLHHPNDVALIHVLGGRLLLHNEELAYIEKFDLSTDLLKGYIVVINKTKQTLKKANWIKKILTIGGKNIMDGSLPEEISARGLHDFLLKIRYLKELIIVRLKDKEVTCYVFEFSYWNLIVDILSLDDFAQQLTIEYSDIVCIELRTTKINEQADIKRLFPPPVGFPTHHRNITKNKTTSNDHQKKHEHYPRSKNE